MTTTIKRRTIVLDDGFRVGVLTGGSGVPLVFLHGLSLSASAYTEMLELLALNGFRVYALDAVDHGATDALPFGHTVADMADVTVRALDALGVDRAVMVGHSMGGGMVVEFAARHPERTLAAVLVDAAAGPEYHLGIRPLPYATAFLWTFQRLGGALVDLVGDAFAMRRTHSLRECLGLYRVLGRSAASSGSTWVRAAYALMRADTLPLLEVMRGSGVHTIVVHGDCDQLIPFASGASTARLTNGRLHRIAGGFHSWMLADPVMAAGVITYYCLDLVEESVA